MNPNDAYLVNRGNNEHPSWEPAHWEHAAEVRGFHVMSLDMDGVKVTKHESAIRSLKADTKALEAEMERLLKCQELNAEAKRLLQAALESQRTGKLEWSV